MNVVKSASDTPGTFENQGAAHAVRVVVRVNEYFLSSIISTVLEGGVSNSWFPVVRLVEDSESDIRPRPPQFDGVATERYEGETWNEYISRNVALGGTLTVYEDADEDGENMTPHTLTREKLIEGLSRFLQRGRSRASTADDGTFEYDLDADDADIIIQYALLGDIVYG